MLVLGLLLASVANAAHVRGRQSVKVADGKHFSGLAEMPSVDFAPNEDLVAKVQSAEAMLKKAEDEQFKATHYLDSVLKPGEDPDCVKAARKFLAEHKDACAEDAKKYLQTVQACSNHVDALPSGAKAPDSIMETLKLEFHNMMKDLTEQNFKTDDVKKDFIPPEPTVWGTSPNHFVFKREIAGAPGGWEQIRGRLIHVSQGSGFVWGVSMPHSIYRCKLPCNKGTWIKVPGNLIQLDAGTEEVWGVTMGNMIYKRKINGEGSWTSVPGKAAHITVGLGWVYSVAPSSSKVYKCKMPCTGTWELLQLGIPGAERIKQLDAGSEQIWAVTSKDNLLYTGYDQSSGPTPKDPKKPPMWTICPGKAKYVSTGNGWVWATSVTNSVYKCKIPCKGEWSVVPGALEQVDLGIDVKIAPPQEASPEEATKDKPAGPSSTLYGVSPQHYIYEGLIDGRGELKQVLGRLKHVTVSKEWVWGVTLPNSVYKCKRPCEGGWKQDKNAPKLTSIDAGEELVFGVDGVGLIYRKKVDGTGSWVKVDGTAKQVSVGNGWLWAVTFEDTIMNCRLPCNDGWQKVAGNLMQVDAGISDVWGWNSQHKFLVRRPLDGSGHFQVVRKPTDGTEIQSISVGDDYVWATTGTDKVVYCKLPCDDGAWKVKQVPGGLQQIDCGLPSKSSTPN